MFSIFRSRTLFTIHEDENVLDVAEDGDVFDVAGGEDVLDVPEDDLGIIMPRVPEDIDEGLVAVDDQLQDIAAALPVPSR